MSYINTTPNPSGAYPAPQSNPAPGLIPLTEEQAAAVLQYNGFVTITSEEEVIEDDFTRTVYTVTPNTKAWEEWKASLPEETAPPPTQEERLAALEGAMLSMMGVQSNV